MQDVKILADHRSHVGRVGRDMLLLGKLVDPDTIRCPNGFGRSVKGTCQWRRAAVSSRTCVVADESEGTEPSVSASLKAARQLGEVLDSRPALVGEAFRGDTRLTTRWRHGALHDTLAGMPGHVILTYYGRDQDIVWRSAGHRIASRTRTGTVTVIPGGHDGRWDIAGPIEVSHVFLTEERLQHCADMLARGQRVELLGRVGFEDPAAARILELLGRDAAHGDASSRLFTEQAIDLLCTQLLRGHSSFGALPVEGPRRGLADWQTSRVISFMRDHLDAAISLDDLAGLVNLSRFHFCTAFRLATGQTPHEWLVRQRVARACELLAEPSLSITEIALMVGYQTPSSFAAAFRRVTSVTPRDFRMRL